MMLYMQSSSDLIGSREAGDILGRSPRTVHRLVSTGDLVPAAKVPGGYDGVFLFHRRDVERLARKRRLRARKQVVR